MASLVKNGDTYGLVWTDRSRRQEQTRESLKTSDIKTARKRKARLEAEYWEGRHDPWEYKWYQRQPEPFKVRLGDAIKEFIQYKTQARGRRGWNSKTAQKESFAMRNYARVIGEDKALSEITGKDMERLYYRDGVSSDHTRNSDYISMRTFFNWCIDRGYMNQPPDYRPKKPQEKLPKIIYPDQFKQMIDYRIEKIDRDSSQMTDIYQRSYWIPLGWMMLAGTGMRPSELANLKLHHITGGSVIIGEDFITKDRAERLVPLLYEAAPASYLLTNPSFRQAEPYMSSSDYLLGRKPSHVARKLSEDFSSTWEKVFPGQPKRTLYNLKNTFCVRFLSDQDSGLAINELRMILGHSSLETTQRYMQAIPHGTKITGTIWDLPVNSQSSTP